MKDIAMISHNEVDKYIKTAFDKFIHNSKCQFSDSDYYSEILITKLWVLFDLGIIDDHDLEDLTDKIDDILLKISNCEM